MPDTKPETPGKPATFAELARERPGLVIGGGIALGLLAGALMPRGAAGKIARGAAGAAALGSELGISLAGKARDTARVAAEEAGEGARRLQRGTMGAAGAASTAGIELARAALKFIASRKG